MADIENGESQDPRERRQAVRCALPSAWVEWERDSLWRLITGRGDGALRPSQKLLDVSILGLGFLAKTPPKAQDPLLLRVFLPGGERPFEGRGRVASIVDHDTPDAYRVGVTFTKAVGRLAGKLRLTGTPIVADADALPESG